MVEVIDNLARSFSSLASSNIFNLNGQLALSALLLILVLAIISFFIYKFYNSVSKRNLIELNLRQYNYSSHPTASKFFAVLLYLIEYMVIMPFLILLWFVGLTVVLWLLAPQDVEVSRVLLISSVVIGAIRISAYYKKELSEDLAKLFPLIALATFMLGFEAFQASYSRVLSNFAEIPLLLNNIFSFVFVIFAG